MKTTTFSSLLLLTALSINISAQEKASPDVQAATSAEKYGKTLNAGIGLGYYGYIGSPTPAFHADFEFDLVKNFTLAPFITFYSYKHNYYWGGYYYSYKNYSYRQTVIPIGVKGSYYFDQLLKANSKWDFYAAGSLGLAIRSTKWESGYYGETAVEQGARALYMDLHAGAEYRMKNKIGLFLDLSSGISTFGLAVHL